MYDLSPFASVHEHEEYCKACGIAIEENSIGFKIFSDTGKIGMCQLYLVGNAAYVMNLVCVSGVNLPDVLIHAIGEIAEFVRKTGVSSLIYPIQSGDDVDLAEGAGFDRLSDTLYALDFVPDAEKELPKQ